MTPCCLCHVMCGPARCPAPLTLDQKKQEEPVPMRAETLPHLYLQPRPANSDLWAPRLLEEIGAMEEGIIPTLDVVVMQRRRTKRVAEMLTVINRICREEDAYVDRLFDHKPTGRWLTVITVNAKEEFTDLPKAEAWWSRLRAGLAKELPHQRLLSKPVGEMKFKKTCRLYLAMAEALPAPLDAGE